LLRSLSYYLHIFLIVFAAALLIYCHRLFTVRRERRPILLIALTWSALAASAACFALAAFVPSLSALADSQATTILPVLAVLAAAMLRRGEEAKAPPLRDALRELDWVKSYDSLTQLPNRRLFEAALGERIEAAVEPNFAVILIGLDNFKLVNDAFDHGAADLALIEIARRLGTLCGDTHLLSRGAGDEFVMLIEDDEAPRLNAFIEHLRLAINRPMQSGERVLKLSASFGVARYPLHGRSVRELLTNAKAAMRDAKTRGRNLVLHFDDEQHAAPAGWAELMHDLPFALERGQLELHYQPKLKAETGVVCGAEALLRWRHPRLGLLSADRFVALAERTGLIIGIGEWALVEVCRQLRAWRDAGHQDWTLALNISAVQLAHPGLLAAVRHALSLHPLPAGRLVLEITESAAMRDHKSSLALLHRLVTMGVSISIDDFGTGYSSLLYLKTLPAAELKIDRGFILGLGSGRNDAAIVMTIITLGRALGFDVVAEGVETPEQRSLLAGWGCTTLQGYLFGRPMPLAEFEERFVGPNLTPPAPAD
jgi:diguanylate cyclase (GGDEF)-like protein